MIFWRRRFRVTGTQAKRERKQNEIRLSANNRLIQFQVAVMEKIWYVK